MWGIDGSIAEAANMKRSTSVMSKPAAPIAVVVSRAG
jgi:hypothetical protein